MERVRMMTAIEGEGVSPETMKLRDLVEVLKLFEAAVAAETGEYGPDERNRPALPLNLVGIESGSAMVVLESPTHLAGVVERIAGAVSSGEYASLELGCHEKLRRLYQFVRGRDWAFRFRADQDVTVDPAEISAEQPVPETAGRVIRGATTILATLTKIGGEECRAYLKPIPRGRLITARINRKMAKELGDRLFEDVALEGIASWTLDGDEIVDFEVTGITGHQPSSMTLEEMFAKGRELTGGAWDAVDAAGYVRGLRAEEG